ncbi:HDL376Cp [Eremothecium sinecaudum]|uniref:HDL376Cp n=1 Tax=Eremothecium sinecaudum TaxID=45286 RepID=A0A109UYT9_9SACH|nr:HDL376Cp [Eremothecium sinecaudum]AMD20368.1 HDL376Cp [Eremothecium sinecaudum]
MSSIKKQLQAINKISLTPKSQIIVNNANVASLKLTFQYDNFDGHMGARKFWHNYLPTLQFYNPRLPIEVTRIVNKDKNKRIPCTLNILGHDGRIAHEVDMRNKRDDEIMEELLTVLDHKPVPKDEIIQHKVKQ